MMINTIPTIDTRFVQSFVGFLERHQVPMQDYLAQVHLPRALVQSGRARVSKVQFCQLAQLVATGESCPELGFYGCGLNGEPEFARAGALSAPTLVRALQNWGLFVQRNVDGSDIRVISRDGSLWLGYSALNDGLEVERWVMNQLVLSSLIAAIRLVAGEDWYPEEVGVIGGVETIGGYRSIPLYPKIKKVHFGFGWMAVQFPSELLLQPLLKSAVADKAEVDVVNFNGFDHAEASMLINPVYAGFSENLKMLVSDQLDYGNVLDVSRAAHICGVSERTLTRRLHDEGLNYRSLVNQVRYNKACELLLHDRGLKVEAVAHLLGYSRLNSFVRAFRNFSGMTPTQFRGGLQAGALA